MLVNTNRDALYSLAKNFYDVTRTLIAIYDANRNIICSYPDKMSPFCTQLRKSETLTQRCLECDRKALEHCAETHKIHIYKCHIGLVEIAAPIIQNELVIGYILFGQITDNTDKSQLIDGLEELAKNFSLNFEELLENARKIRYRSEQYITAIAKMMEMCAGYIWQNSFISIKNDSTSHAIDIYIQEHLSENLSVAALCKCFHICRSTLYSISKEHFGCGISEYVTSCRINKAKEMLKKNLSVYYVAESVGIKDVNNFIRIFKKYTGTTPAQFRKSVVKSGNPTNC